MCKPGQELQECHRQGFTLFSPQIVLFYAGTLISGLSNLTFTIALGTTVPGVLLAELCPLLQWFLPDDHTQLTHHAAPGPSSLLCPTSHAPAQDPSQQKGYQTPRCIQHISALPLKQTEARAGQCS